MQTVSDELCREYGLSVIENPQYGKSKQYGEWRAEQEQRPTWRGLIRADIDEAIRQSMTERQFFDNLRKKGYEVKIGKDISVRPPGKERFVRLIRNFGEDYSLEQIRRRILLQAQPEKKQPEPPHKVIRIRLLAVWKRHAGLQVSARCIFTIATCWGSSRKTNPIKTGGGFTFSCVRICENLTPSPPKQGYLCEIVLIPPSSFFRINPS